MAKKFNPLDPLGLFNKGRVPEYSGSGRAWSPPQPPSLPDPLHIFKVRSHPAGNPGSSGATIGNPIPIEWADTVIPLKNQARQVLIGHGYQDKQVDMALHWAEEWLMGMARRMAPGNTELQKTVVVSAYADIANRAEKWLQGIEAAFTVSPRMPAQMA